MASQTAAGRVQRDLKEVLRLTFESSPPIFVHVEDSVTTITALIIGPPSTPYHGAFLLFRLSVQADYPNTPPHVKLLTCDSGRTRLNPNLYADGKVCLSILGTWRGETTETWRSSYSLNYVLQAIQCMVLTDDPYHNEPGFEKGSARCEAPALVEGYTDKIFHEAMRLGVCEVLECLLELPIVSPMLSTGPPPPQPPPPPPPAGSLPQSPKKPDEASPEFPTASTASSPGQTPIHAVSSWPTDAAPDGTHSPSASSSPPSAASAASPAAAPVTFATIPGHRHPLASSIQMFRHLIKRYFLTFYSELRRRLQDARLNARNATDFPVCLFECGSNAARGRFQFDALVSRLDRIRQQLGEEESAWRRKGAELTSRRSYLSLMLLEEAVTLQSELGRVSGGPVDANNAFVWKVTLLQPESDLFADSMYTVELVFSPELREPPRARFVQSICHPNISPDGVPLYFLRENDIPQDKRFRPTAVVRQILDLLSSDPNSSPTAWVNEAAAADCFSRDPDKVKKFRRMCRQLSERTLE
jgi:ubiquitin-protein ligase